MSRIPYAETLPRRAKLTLYPTGEVDGMILTPRHPLDEPPQFEPFDSAALRGNGR